MAREVIADLVAQISIDGTKFNTGMGQVNRQLKTVREELKSARSRFRQTGDSADFLGDRSKTLSGQLKLQESRVELLNRAYKESVDSTGEFSKRSQNLATQLEKAKRELSETEHELSQVNEELRNLPNRWQTLGDQAQAAGEKMQNAGRNMMSTGRNLTMGVTAPIVAAGASVFKLASDWETAFAGVEKTVDGTAQEMEGLESAIRNMAKEIPASTTEIAAVAEAAGQLGIEVGNIEEFTRVMIDLGNSTNLSADQAATTFARFANIVGMSQDDFDKLGSTVVDLGNNLATTEAEITEMALRLAGAGSQIGLTEAETLSFAAALSSVGIEAEAGGSAFSKVMVNMQLAAEKGGDELKAFAEVAGMSADDFKKSFEEDATGAIIQFIEGLASAEDRGLSAIGILDEMGIKEVRLRDSLLRAAGASDVFTEAIELGSGAWEENTALTDEAGKRYETTASQLEVFWNRLKDTGITLGEVLVPALMDALDAAEPLIEKIEDGAQAFADMTEEEQQTILKMIGLAAAAGPVIFGLGGITTAAGGFLKMGGGLLSMLGKAGGKGLLGRLATMGITGGPVGIAIAGAAGLGTAIYAVTQASKENLEETLKSIDARRDEIDTLDKTIEEFEKLQDKNKLTTDEVLRYMDIMDELKNAKSEEAIAALTEEQDELLKKSGFTNEEMKDFLGLNDEIVKKSPSTSQAISEQGNAYAEVLDEVKKLNEAERQRLTDDTYLTLTQELSAQRDNLAEQKQLKEEISELENEQTKSLEYQRELTQQIEDENLTIAGIKERMKTASQDELPALEEELNYARENKRLAELTLMDEQDSYDNLIETIQGKKDSLAETEKELELFEQLKDDYAAMVLYEQGIVAEKGKAVETLQREQEELDKARGKLEKLGEKNGKNTTAYKEQNQELQEQQRKIDTAREKLEEMNLVAGETIYKDIEVRTRTDNTYESLGKTIVKRINVNTSGAGAIIGAQPIGYAEGTPSGGHPGGPFIAGEEGPELAKVGSRWSMLGFGLYDAPKGAQVFTHNESMKIMSALNNLPGYATGARPAGEANRIINDLNQLQNNEPSQIVVQQMVVQKESDIEDIARSLHRLQKQSGRVTLG